jgi:hypothetical protein
VHWDVFARRALGSFDVFLLPGKLSGSRPAVCFGTSVAFVALGTGSVPLPSRALFPCEPTALGSPSPHRDTIVPPDGVGVASGGSQLGIGEGLGGASWIALVRHPHHTCRVARGFPLVYFLDAGRRVTSRARALWSVGGESKSSEVGRCLVLLSVGRSRLVPSRTDQTRVASSCAVEPGSDVCIWLAPGRGVGASGTRVWVHVHGGSGRVVSDFQWQLPPKSPDGSACQEVITPIPRRGSPACGPGRVRSCSIHVSSVPS